MNTGKRAYEIYREEGLGSLLRKSHRHLKQKVGLAPSSADKSHTYQLRRQEAVEIRWQMIEPYVDPETSLLDIGCSTGLLTAKAAEAGAFALGVDHHEETIAKTRDYHDKRSNLHFIDAEIDGELIPSLPEFDIVLLFSVFQYWHQREGEAEAMEWLTRLGEKTNSQLFFEAVGKSSKLGPEATFTNYDEEEVTDFHEELLTDALGETFDISYVGTTPRKEGASGERYVFMLERVADENQAD